MRSTHYLLAVVVALTATRPAAALQTEEIFDLIAMPLAVAAVAEVTGVPQSGLVSLVEALNSVSAPPAEVIEIVTYSPVLLADPAREPHLITSITNEVARGISREELVTMLRNEILDGGIDHIEVVERSRIRGEESSLVPQVVIRRVEEMRSHPHGGPPGQLKKERGAQTGAEIVHGTDPRQVNPRSSARPSSKDVGEKRGDPGQSSSHDAGRKNEKPGGSEKGRGKGKDR